jgi:hypothetical protein
MLEKLGRTKSPQRRKQEAYANEYRYCFEYRNGAVRAWAKKKRRNQREARHKVRQFATGAVNSFGAEDSADRLADRVCAVRSYKKLHKSGVLTLRDTIEHKRATGRRPVY